MNPSLVGRLSPGIAAVLFGGLALRSGAIDVAGSLLIDLEAADYNAVDGQWPQNTATGIPGNFLKQANGTPRLQTVAGAPAIVLDGDGDYFTGPFTTSALHAASAKHSVEYWVYQGQVRPEESVLSWSYRNGPNGTFAGFRYGSNPDYGAAARWGAPDAGFAAPHAGGPAAGTWHHIVITYDGNLQKIYVDGALNSTETVGVLDAHDTQPIYIGSERNSDATHTDAGSFFQFSGAISKIRVHSDALTDANVLNNYNSELAAHPGTTTAALSKPPVHRWSFDNAAGAATDGATIPDSIGGLEAVVRGNNGTFTGTGIALPGGPGGESPAYVDLPNGIVSANERISIELWATQTSNKTWSRMMSFGVSTAGEVSGPGGSFNGSENLVLYGNQDGNAHNRFQRTGGTISNGADARLSNNSVQLGTEFHYVIVFDPDFAEWRLYRNGFLMEVLPETQGPKSIEDVNNWLGRSEFANDQYFNGTFNELRVYNYTLSESEIRGNTLAGAGTLNTGTAPSVFQWTPDGAGTFAFNSAANWGGVSFPDAPGVFANMTKNLTGDQTVNLNTQITVGALSFGDTDFSNLVTIAAGTGGSLEMNAGAGNIASLTQSGGSFGNEISAPVTLTTDTSVSNASGTTNPLTLSGSISGSAKLSKSGSGPVVLTGNNAGFTGPLAINGGRLAVGNGGTTGTLGSGAISTTDEATLAFDRSDNVTFSQTITGGGLLTYLGAGTFTNTGTISNTGNLDVPTGTFINDATVNGVQSVRIDGTGIFRGNSTTTINGWTAWGYVDGADITVQDNASIEINAQGDFNVADVGLLGTGTTTLRMTGGSITSTSMFVGKNASLTGYILQSGGTITDRAGGADNRIGGNNAAAAAATGGYVMSAGELTTNTNLQIGGFGTGSFIQSGGTVNSTGGWTVAGRYSEATSRAKGLMDISGGVHNQNFGGGGVLVGEEGEGVLEVRGTGTLNVANRLVLGGRDADGATAPSQSGYGVANLATGGTISTGFVAQDSSNNGVPYGVFNFRGGTLKANRDTVNFFEGLDEARIWQQGAVIDTNGFNVTVLQPLDPPAGSGVATIPVTNGGSGYTIPPIIRISSDPATGTGATAVAVVNASGTVTGITITNPGSGYTEAPLVTVAGEGGGSGLTLGTPTLAANNTSGGLTKKGAGALRLNGFNTYTGNTLVEGGGIGGNGYIDGNISFAPNSNGYFAARITNDPVPAADKLTVLGTLNLTNASLQVDITGAMTGEAYIIANYEEGALVGTFGTTNLPPGWEVDYAYDDGFGSTKNIAIVPGDMTPYDSWISGFFPGETNPEIVGATSDPDGDGQPNSLEFALGGTPNSGADRAKIYNFSADSSADADTTKELVITFAVLQGTPAFTGTPSPASSTAGYTYTVQGSTDLSGFTAAVVPVNPVTTGLPGAPAGYEYRSFSLSGSNGTPSKGFLRVQVTP